MISGPTAASIQHHDEQQFFSRNTQHIHFKYDDSVCFIHHTPSTIAFHSGGLVCVCVDHFAWNTETSFTGSLDVIVAVGAVRRASHL